jgi:hypothetical protein
VVVYDIAKKETRFTYANIGNNNPATAVASLQIYGQNLYLALKTGIYFASLTHPNLADDAAWKKVTDDSLPSMANARILTTFKDTLYAVLDDTLFAYHPDKGWHHWKGVSFDSTHKIKYVNGDSRSFRLHYADICYVYMVANGFSDRFNTYANYSVVSNSTKSIWLATENEGLVKYDIQFVDFARVNPFCQPTNFCNALAVGTGELYIAPKGLDNIVPSYESSGIYFYNLRKNEWIISSRFNGGLSPDLCNSSFIAAQYDLVSKKAYIASFDGGVVVMQGGKRIEQYDKTNSGLQGVLVDNQGRQDAIRARGLALQGGDLWVSSYASPKPLNCRTADGNWYAYSLSTGNETTSILVDNNGFKWILYFGNNLVVFDERGTLDNTADDRLRLLTAGKGNGLGDIASSRCSSITKDLTGAIWLGTASGVVVFYNSRGIFNASAQTDAVCPIYQGRCLLKDENISAIAVDGANRKWIGTGNGVFLVSADGTEIIANFNKSNSPLFSNNILDIEIEPETGEVFIATDLGLISYMGTATSPRENSDSLVVFPNPVPPDYRGLITIRGSVAEGLVRICNSAGQLVRELRSEGGQTIWDGKDANGNKVAAGVYVILLANSQGSGSGYAKVAISGY